MTRHVLSVNYTDNHASGGIVRVIGVGITIFCALCFSSLAHPVQGLSLELHPCMHIPAVKPPAANAQIPADLPLHIARWHSARTCV